MTEDIGLLGRLEEKLSSLASSYIRQEAVQDERWRKIEPVLMERSGEVQRMKDVAEDLNALGKKWRESEARAMKIEDSVRHLENRQNKVFWMFMGATAVLQFLWIFVGDAIQKALSSGVLNR